MLLVRGAEQCLEVQEVEGRMSPVLPPLQILVAVAVVDVGLVPALVLAVEARRVTWKN